MKLLSTNQKVPRILPLSDNWGLYGGASSGNKRTTNQNAPFQISTNQNEPQNLPCLRLQKHQHTTGGVTHRLQDVHHGAHQLVDVSIRDETLHLFVSRHVGRHADAQRDVACHPLDIIAIRRKLCGVEPTLEIKGGSVRVVMQRFGDSNVLVVQTFEHRRSRIVHAAGIDPTHTSHARALVSDQLPCTFKQTLAALPTLIGMAVRLNVLYVRKVCLVKIEIHRVRIMAQRSTDEFCGLLSVVIIRLDEFINAHVRLESGLYKIEIIECDSGKFFRGYIVILFVRLVKFRNGRFQTTDFTTPMKS